MSWVQQILVAIGLAAAFLVGFFALVDPFQDRLLIFLAGCLTFVSISPLMANDVGYRRLIAKSLLYVLIYTLTVHLFAMLGIAVSGAT